jgi:hypothetical protein
MDVVLERDRDPVERTPHPAPCALDVEAVRLLHRIGIEGDHTVESALIGGDSVQIHLHQLLRVDAMRLERMLNLGNGRLDELERGRPVRALAVAPAVRTREAAHRRRHQRHQ